MKVFKDLKNFLSEDDYQQFLQSPFGFFNDIHEIKVQPQLLRHLLLLELDNHRDDIFVIKVNGTELRFGIKEFTAVTGLKCGADSKFVSDPDVPNRFIELYFPEKKKIKKSELYTLFSKKENFRPEDRFKIGVIYFISSFLLSFDPTKTWISKTYFDLVESGEYINYPWGNEVFRLTLDVCCHKLIKDPSSFKFAGFHLAIQIWFYECCSWVDSTIAIRQEITFLFRKCIKIVID